jgi:hypothetical protein
VLPASASEALSVMVSPPVEAARGTMKFAKGRSCADCTSRRPGDFTRLTFEPPPTLAGSHRPRGPVPIRRWSPTARSCPTTQCRSVAPRRIGSAGPCSRQGLVGEIYRRIHQDEPRCRPRQGCASRPQGQVAGQSDPHPRPEPFRRPMAGGAPESDEAGTLVDPIDAGRPPRRKAPASPSAGPLGWG